jgi:hypothetical protein
MENTAMITVNRGSAVATRSFKSRPREYVEMLAGDIVPHPLNPRVHSADQRQVLEASLEQFGDVRSLLCFRLSDGRVMNLDGHLRAAIDPRRPVKVELLTDITEDEARALLMTLDPLAALASYDDEKLNELRATVQADNDLLHNLWQSLARHDEETLAGLEKARRVSSGPRPAGMDGQYYVLVECGNEQEQIRLFRRLRKEGLNCQLKTC